MKFFSPPTIKWQTALFWTCYTKRNPNSSYKNNAIYINQYLNAIVYIQTSRYIKWKIKILKIKFYFDFTGKKYQKIDTR